MWTCLLDEYTKRKETHMAFAASAGTGRLENAWSLGPIKVQYMTWSAASADVAGTVTASRLSTAEGIIIIGLELTAAPTFATNVVTLAFTDPGATVHGTLLVLGR